MGHNDRHIDRGPRQGRRAKRRPSSLGATASALFINSDKGAASRMSLARSPPFFGDRFVNRLIR